MAFQVTCHFYLFESPSFSSIKWECIYPINVIGLYEIWDKLKGLKNVSNVTFTCPCLWQLFLPNLLYMTLSTLISVPFGKARLSRQWMLIYKNNLYLFQELPLPKLAELQLTLLPKLYIKFTSLPKFTVSLETSYVWQFWIKAYTNESWLIFFLGE